MSGITRIIKINNEKESSVKMKGLYDNEMKLEF